MTIHFPHATGFRPSASGVHFMNPALSTSIMVFLALFATRAGMDATPATGPLTPCKENPRYFADPTGKAVYLTGSHTWNNLQDMGPTDPPAAFDFTGYLDFLERHHLQPITPTGLGRR
jgi:hypothetical protein